MYRKDEVMDNDLPRGQCPEGFDYRMLRGYLRAHHEERLPEPILRHVMGCDTCSGKWRFLEKTDPVVQGQYMRQVTDLISQVEVLPIYVTAPAYTAGVATAGAVDDFVSALTSVQDEAPKFHVVSPSDVDKECAKVREIEEDENRRVQALLLSKRFTALIESSGLYGEFGDSYLKATERRAPALNLAELAKALKSELSLDARELAAAAFAGAFLHVSYVRTPVLFKWPLLFVEPLFRIQQAAALA